MSPLQGLLLLDLSTNLPGPYCSRMLADLGARVIKIEPPHGDGGRHFGPPVDGVSAFTKTLHSGKESLTLNLKSNAGAELLLRLVRQADALLEGFRPGVLARLGLGLEKLQDFNPRLVVASLSGYGHTGPLRDWPGHDANFLGLSGALAMFGAKPGEPVLPTLQIADMTAGLQMVIGILAALIQRQRTGRGCLVSTSMYEASLSLVSIYMGFVRAGEDIRAGQTILSGTIPAYELYPAQDGRVLTVCALEPKFWQALCEGLERPEWLSRHFDPTLKPELAALLATRPAQHWLDELAERACLGPVLELGEAMAEPQAVALGMFQDGIGAAPWSFDGRRPQSSKTLAKWPGAHRDALLTEFLGLSPAEIRTYERQSAFSMS